MIQDDYLIEYDNFKFKSINNLLDRIKRIKGKRLNELKISDLSYHNSEIIWPGEGIYIFRSNDKIIYVGKVSSMSFTERIPKHFDVRHFAWFNRLLKLICKKILSVEWNDNNAIISSQYAFKYLDLVLINFTTRERINKTESLLRASLNPLNKFKTHKTIDAKNILHNY